MESINLNKIINNNTFNEKVQTLDINISNLVLTPLTCASLISEIFKCLIYEKSLIPYPYNWLKNVVTKRRKSIVQNEKKNVCNERNHRVASAAFDATENIINNVKKLYKLGNKITEFLILIGATPLNPKEVYRINIPTIANGHYESNHFSMISKYQPKILRTLLLSEEWMSKMEQTLPLTNLYVYVKVAADKSVVIDTATLENVIPSSSFYVPKSAQSLTINLLYDTNVLHNCCANLTIYEDKCIEAILQENNENIQEQECIHDSRENDIDKNEEYLELTVDWLQINSTLKGFK